MIWTKKMDNNIDMKYCSFCGKPIQDGYLFCGSCGKPLVANNDKNSDTTSKRQRHTTSKGKSSWIDSLNEYVGNDRPADLNWKVLFSDVFKSHTMEEAEAIFICGTKATTPSIANVSKDWPHPWLYSRVLLMFLMAFALLWICVSAFSNPNALPGMIVVGSFAVPLSTMILFMEVNAWRNVSMYQVIQTFLVGGCASLVATLFLFSIYSVEELDFVGAFMVGIIEEMGKAIIVYFFLKRMENRSILSGMLIGASVGAGFAAFESAGYALKPLMQFLQYSGYAAAYGQSVDESQMLYAIQQNIFIRGFLAPGGHVAWAAISGAALVIATKWKKTFDIGLFTDSKFLRLFIIPVALHGLWDCPLAELFNSMFPFAGYISLIVIVWMVVLILINMGLAEVSRESLQGK